MLEIYKIKGQLRQLPKMLNVKSASDDFIDIIAGLIQKFLPSEEYLDKIIFQLVCNFSKNSFPKFADFKNVIDANPIDRSRKPYDWEKEYAEKLNISVDKIMVMKYEDYTIYQKQVLNLMSPEQINQLLSNMKHSIKKFEEVDKKAPRNNRS